MNGEKPFYMTKRFRGGFVTILAIAFGLFGVDLDKKETMHLVTELTSLAGAVWALYGGIVASERMKFRG